MAEPTNSKPSSPKAHQNPSNPISSFLYKLILVSIIIALLPIFPPSSQSPDSSPKSILTRSWELLHLLIVGLAISYGLFSRRNSDLDIEKETQLKPDTPQSYVSEILHVSSVFDDDEEIPHAKASELVNETRNQTWNYSQYYPEEPVLNSAAKPLVLPIRSLKSDGSATKEAAVLPSPIPWRSRSGRLEVMEEQPSPKRLSPSHSFSPETSGKINEDFSRRSKSFHRPSPPPPPPPPPPPVTPTSHFVSERRDARKSFKDELQDLSRRSVRSKEAQNLPPLPPRIDSHKRSEFMEKMITEYDSESESEGSGSSESDEEETSNYVSTEEAVADENEVDKKADEFIAKFREQIRLQRIASIKKSTGQRSARNSK